MFAFLFVEFGSMCLGDDAEFGQADLEFGFFGIKRVEFLEYLGKRVYVLDEIKEMARLERDGVGYGECVRRRVAIKSFAVLT